MHLRELSPEVSIGSQVSAHREWPLHLLPPFPGSPLLPLLLMGLLAAHISPLLLLQDLVFK